MVRRGGEREIIYQSLHCHHQNDTCIKMGSDESHFNVSLSHSSCLVKSELSNPYFSLLLICILLYTGSSSVN